MNDEMAISELAQLAGGMTHRTIRFYEEKGLIKVSCTTDGGRKRYSTDALESLHRICVLRESGMPLNEIKNVLNRLWKMPTTHKGQQQAHAMLLLDAREKLQERQRKLTGLLDTINNALENEQRCAGCNSTDCAGCGKLALWSRFGLEYDH